MKAVPKKSLLCLAALLTPALGAAPAFAAGEVKAGLYDSKGTNPDGSAYSGTATITITSDTTCNIVWKSGETPSTGICMRDSDSFAAAYRMGDAVGLVIYKINDDGSLSGVWTVAGQSGAGTETLTPK